MYTEEQKQKIKDTLDWAKSNPNDPKSQEIQKRIKEGKMNYELQAIGLNPYPVEKKPDMGKLMESAQQEQAEAQAQAASVEGKPTENRFMRAIKDIPSDIQETATNLKQAGTDISNKLMDVYKDDDYTLAQKFMATAGAAAKTGVTALDEMAMGAGKLFLTDEAEKGLGNLVREAVTGTNLEATMKKAGQWYDGLDKDNKLTLDAALPIGELMAEFAIIGKAAPPTRELVSEGVDTAMDVARKTPQAIEAGEEFIEGAAKATGEAIDSYRAARRPERIAKQEAKANEAVGRVLQAGNDPQALEAAKRAFSNIETNDIKSYTDLNQKLRDKVEASAKAQDQYLNQFTERYTRDTTGKYTKVGDKTVIENPIVDAIDGLENAYRKGGEASKAEEMVQLREVFNTQGLTVKDLNDLARRYGIEFKDRAFNKMGDPKTGYNAEAYENVRKGIKDVVRERLPDDQSKAIDAGMSDIYDTLRLTEGVESKVAKLYQRIRNRTLAQKIGGGAAALVDLASLGTLRGFIAKLLPSNMGNKAMNAIEIEQELSRNLKELDKLLSIKGEGDDFARALENYVQNMHPGLGIKKTPEAQMKEIDNQIAQLNKNLNDAYTSGGKASDANIKSMEQKLGSLYRQRDKIDSSFNQGEIPQTTDLDILPKGPEVIRAPEAPSEYSYTYYHSAPRSAIESIKKEGFNTEDVYLWPDPKTAQMYAAAQGGGKPGKTGAQRSLDEDWVVLEVKAKNQLEIDKRPDADNEARMDNPEWWTLSPEDVWTPQKQASLDGRISEWGEWLDGWANEDSSWIYNKNITDEDILDLQKTFEDHKPQETITLYRGTSAAEEGGERLSSWTKDRGVAESFGDKVLERKVSPEEIVVDFESLPEDVRLKFNLDEYATAEREVLLLPDKLNPRRKNVCKNCIDEAERINKERGLPIVKGVLVPEAKTRQEALDAAFDIYKTRQNVEVESERIGNNTHAWNLDEQGRVVDDHKGGLEAKPEDFKYVSQEDLYADKLLSEWTDMGEDGYGISGLNDLEEVVSRANLPKGVDEPITLYRGTVEGEDLSDRFSSWTSLREVAEEHAAVNGGRVVERTVDPDEILVSLTDLPNDLKAKYNVIEDEEEFILKPLK